MSEKRFIKRAALSAAAIASLVGAPSAAAQVVCVPPLCPEPIAPAIGSDTAFLKLAENGLPGNTAAAFFKQGLGPGETAFNKLATSGFPGNTEDVFFKFFKQG